MNIADVAAAGGYGALKPTPANPDLSAMGQRFAEVFDRADDSVQGFATGLVDAQSVVQALSQAELALQTAVTIRDRIVSAYQEVLRMPL